jgi:hypothetical protein
LKRERNQECQLGFAIRTDVSPAVGNNAICSQSDCLGYKEHNSEEEQLAPPGCGAKREKYSQGKQRWGDEMSDDRMEVGPQAPEQAGNNGGSK